MSDEYKLEICDHCKGYYDSAGFHHNWNCPIRRPEQFDNWDANKTPFGELYDDAIKIKSENDALRAKLQIAVEAFEKLLSSSFYQPDAQDVADEALRQIKE